MTRRRRARGRDVHGILLLDKPVGITSNEALQKVKHLYQAKKAGHTGSLDRLASGLLPICFGEATKLSGYLLDSDKYYQASCRLGITTSTGDAAGDVLEERAIPVLDEQKIEAVLEQFRGELQQVPPMYSALKHKGERLYKLAYQGIEVDREPRPVTIYELKLLSFDQDSIRLDVRCSKGTYVRTLAEDIGEQLGCGAHVAELRRLGAGPFEADDMVTLEELETKAEAGFAVLDSLLLPLDSAVQSMPEVVLADSVAYYLCQGQPVTVPQAPTSGYVRLYHQNKDFIGIGLVLDDGRIGPKRLLN